MDEVHIARDEGGKGRFRAGAGVLREQLMVVGHSPVRCPCRAKPDKLFSIIFAGRQLDIRGLFTDLKQHVTDFK